ncbi:alpha/beta fold hydrolase [Sulfitobacter sp. 916]|uniref:alpha/beta fold hydrolase n=1 Tax=Sulfitobacter sp. 916 TaxID=3368559 RepID=UPI0037464C74
MALDLKDWIGWAAADRVFAWKCRGLSLRLALRSSDGEYGLLLCDAPRALEVEELERPDIVIEGPQGAFDKVARADPPPGSHSFGALLRHDTGLEITAEPVAQAQALAALERLIELARPPAPYFEGHGFVHDSASVAGRRMLLRRVGGREALVHWIESGAGQPVVFLHTAGADSRQYLHQLADTELQGKYRMMAFDLPWHGLSSGEDGSEVTVDYRLSEAAYLEWVCAFIVEVAGAPVILVGCSMGATMALTVTARRPDLVRGCIALEAPMNAPGRRSELLTDARIADSQHNPAYVRAMLGPACPQRQRDEACAIYAQARPGVYMGDLAYYSEEYDGAHIAGPLRDSARPLALLTGSYDYSASPAATRSLCRAVKSDVLWFDEMSGLGHFPMIEDPTEFRPHFLNALRHVERLQS